MKQKIILMMLILLATNVNAATVDISCLYETTEKIDETTGLHHHAAEKPAAKWYFWRTANEIEVSNAVQSFGEKWTLTDKSKVMYQALYHDKKFLLDFQPADLKILGKKINWEAKTTLIPKSLLKSLVKKQEGTFNGYKMVRYEGVHAGTEYQIDWLPELDIPASVSKTVANKQVITVLKQVFPLNKSPFKQLITEKYDDMDYADIGDNESHPVVAQLQKNSGVGYFHQH